MNITQLQYTLEQLLPSNSALEGDRIGLQIESQTKVYKKLLICLEINEEVIDEAVNKSCQCIITFHPLIFTPLGEISQDERVGNLTYKLIKNDISVYCVHTCFDTAPFGNNAFLASLFQLSNIEMIEEIDIKNDVNIVSSSNKKYGMGRIGTLPKELSQTEFIELCSDIFLAPIRFNNNNNSTKKINKIAILGGSGSSYIGKVLNRGVDAFITADNTYHNYHRVIDKMMLVDVGHYEMEQYIPKVLMNEMIKSELFSHLELITSKIYTNPVNYYPDSIYNKKQIKYLTN